MASRKSQKSDARPYLAHGTYLAVVLLALMLALAGKLTAEVAVAVGLLARGAVQVARATYRIPVIWPWSKSSLPNRPARDTPT